MKSLIILAAAGLLATAALAKLPPPTDEAKAKAAEAAAKTAWSGKVDAWQLCKSQDRVAAFYYKTSKAEGKPTAAPVETPACVDPGPFVYSPPGAPVVAAAAAAAPAAAAPAQAAKKP
jgi:hypothetical protein